MSGRKRDRLKSFFKGKSGSSSLRSDDGASGGYSPAASTSVMSLPPSSSQHDSSRLSPTGSRPTDTHSIHEAIMSRASSVTPDQLLRSKQKETTASENTRTNTQGSLVPQPSAHTAVGDKATLPDGKFLLSYIRYFAVDQHA